MGRRQGILKNNHDDMDVDTKSSPHCHEKDAMDIEHPDDDHQRDSNAMDVDNEVPRKRVRFSHSEFVDIKPHSEMYGKYIPLDSLHALIIGNISLTELMCSQANRNA